MGTAQMNIRLDTEVKAAGDRGMATAGFTPTEVVRMVWGFAAKNEQKPENIRKAMRSLQEGNLESEAQKERKRLAFTQLEEVDGRLRKIVGGSVLADPPQESAAAFRERALVERMAEKGLW